MMRPVGLALATLPLVYADVQFTAPAAGANVAAGTIDVKWKDNGNTPSIEDLTAYTLVLMVGGNDDSDMLPLTTFVAQGDFASGNEAQGTIPSGIAAPVPNGFFFKITSSSSTGGVVINYSDRFPITGLTGTTASTYRDAAEALNGSTEGPPSVGDSSISSASSSSSSTSASAASSTIKHRHSPTPVNSIVTVTHQASATPGVGAGNGSSSRQGGGISKSALIGIAIAGAGVGLVGVGLAIWAFVRRKRRKERGLTKLEDSPDHSAQASRKEMSVATPVELDASVGIVEADHGSPRSELASTNIRAELEGDSVRGEVLGSPFTPITPVPWTPVSAMTLRSMGSMMSLTTETSGTPVTPRDNV